MENDWPKKLSAILGGSLLLPFVVELGSALLKGEPFSLERALVFIAVIGGISAILLAVGRARTATLWHVMATFLVVTGLVVFGFGFLLALRPDLLVDDAVADVTGLVTSCVGLVVLGAGVLVLVDARSRTVAGAPDPDEAELADTGETGVPKKIDLHRFVRYGPETEGLVALFTERLDATDLHYLAYYARGKAVFRVDMLDDPSVTGMLGLTSAHDRREAYERQGEDLRALVSQMDTEFDEIDSGRLTRLVLDVEKGALYYFVVHGESQRTVVGVTLGQHAVVETDVEMQRLVDDIRGYLGYSRPASV